MNECQARLGSHLILYAPHFPSKLDLSLIASQESAIALLHSFRSKNSRLRAWVRLLQCCCTRCSHSLSQVGGLSLFIACASVPERLLDCYKTQIARRNNIECFLGLLCFCSRTLIQSAACGQSLLLMKVNRPHVESGKKSRKRDCFWIATSICFYWESDLKDFACSL